MCDECIHDRSILLFLSLEQETEENPDYKPRHYFMGIECTPYSTVQHFIAGMILDGLQYSLLWPIELSAI